MTSGGTKKNDDDNETTTAPPPTTTPSRPKKEAVMAGMANTANTASPELLSATATPSQQQRRRSARTTSFQGGSPEDLRSLADDRASLFSEPQDEDRRLLFDELSFSSVPGNLHLSSDAAIERFVQRYGVLGVVRQLASDLAQREAEVSLLRKQHEDRERELRKMLVQCGVSWSDIDKRLMNMSATSVRKPDSMINELMSEAIDTSFNEDEDDDDYGEDNDAEDDNGDVTIETAEPEGKKKRGWVESIFGRDDETPPEELDEEHHHNPPDQPLEPVLSSASSFQDRGPMEMTDIVPEESQPPTLLPTWNNHYGSKQGQLTDRFGFIYNRNREPKAKRLETTVTQTDVVETVQRKGSLMEINDGKGIQLSTTEPTQASSRVNSQAVSNDDDDGSSVRLLLAQLTDLHDGLQKAQTARWNEFLKKLNNESEQVIKNGQLLGVSGAELLSSGRKGGSGKTAWKEFKTLVYGGVPLVYRPKIYGECSGAWTMKEPGKYESLANQSGVSEAVNQIELDLYRTMPHNVFFGGVGPGVPKLRRVLVAYSRYNPDVGYCQGMNVIAAMLLLTYATEEDAFWSLVSLVENILPEGYFAPPLLTARADQRVFGRYFAHFLPRLSEHFSKLGVEVDAITFDWFLSCFTDALPPDVLFRVWDVFLCVEGPAHLFRTALALFRMYEKELVRLDSGGEVYGYMKNLVNKNVKVDELLRVTNGYHQTVTARDLKRYREKELQGLKQ